MTVQVKAAELYFSVLMFTMLYKLVSSLVSVDEIF